MQFLVYLALIILYLICVRHKPNIFSRTRQLDRHESTPTVSVLNKVIHKWIGLIVIDDITYYMCIISFI